MGRHPLLGIGLGEWLRPAWMHSGSMDNFWLATAVRYGVPALILMVGGIMLALFKVGARQRLDAMQQRCRSAWIVGLTGLMIAGTTVHFWNALFTLFFFLLGAGIWLLDARTNRGSPRVDLMKSGGLV